MKNHVVIWIWSKFMKFKNVLNITSCIMLMSVIVLLSSLDLEVIVIDDNSPDNT